MKKIYKVIALGLFLVLTQCAEKDISFLITENAVGHLSKSTEVDDLETIFAQDSIVMDTTKGKKIKIHEKGGKHLLTLTPKTDSTATVENVRVFDSRYKTDKGISLASTFGEIQKKYPIKKVVTTINSIVIFPKESNLYFTIDKTELPSNLRYNNTNIEAVQIPDNAKIKYLMLGWE